MLRLGRLCTINKRDTSSCSMSGFLTCTKLEIILLSFHCRVIRQQSLPEIHVIAEKKFCRRNKSYLPYYRNITKHFNNAKKNLRVVKLTRIF